MSRRPILVVALTAGLFFGACGVEARGSGDVISESREVSGFNEVVFEGIGTLNIQQTGSESLSIEAKDDIIPYLTTEVENNRLIIGVEDNTVIQTTEPINYELTVKDLSALNLLGSGDAIVQSISTNKLALNLSGSGGIDAASISADELEVTLSGSGDVKTSGKVDSQDVDVSGSGGYEAENLESEEAKVDHSGSGKATISVSDKLDVRLTGSGSVEFSGDPTVSQDISGSGSVRKL